MTRSDRIATARSTRDTSTGTIAIRSAGAIATERSAAAIAVGIATAIQALESTRRCAVNSGDRSGRPAAGAPAATSTLLCLLHRTRRIGGCVNQIGINLQSLKTRTYIQINVLSILKLQLMNFGTLHCIAYLLIRDFNILRIEKLMSKSKSPMTRRSSDWIATGTAVWRTEWIALKISVCISVTARILTWIFLNKDLKLHSSLTGLKHSICRN